MRDHFTVVHLLRELGYQHKDKYINWALGQIMREKYTQCYGTPPEKQLMRKTSGIGVHCFAVYPPEFKDRATAVIHEHFDFVSRQLQFDF